MEQLDVTDEAHSAHGYTVRAPGLLMVAANCHELGLDGQLRRVPGGALGAPVVVRPGDVITIALPVDTRPVKGDPEPSETRVHINGGMKEAMKVGGARVVIDPMP